METNIALIQDTTMSIIHRKALNRVVLTLVTHPLLVMTIITRNATTLLTSANAGAHLTLAVTMSNKMMKELIDLDARRSLVKVYNNRTQVMSDVHSDLSMERRCDLLLILSHQMDHNGMIMLPLYILVGME